MELIKVSIIIPVYNVAPWLGECLESVISQDYENLQIICVNDGSSDDSPQILSGYAEKDPRIVIYDQKNQGPAVARNSGMKLAEGKYISFLDADDLMAKGFLKKAVERIENDSLQILRFNSDYFYESDSIRDRLKGFSHKYDYPGIYTGPDFYQTLKKNHEYSVVVWRSIYLRKFLTDFHITFNYPPHEDDLFTFQCYLLSDRIGFMNEAGVHHRYRDGSIMTVEHSLINVRSRYLIAHAMNLLCYENQDLLSDHTLCFDQSQSEYNIALRIYEKKPELIRSQAVSAFDKAMLRDLDQHLASTDAETRQKNEQEKIRAAYEGKIEEIRSKHLNDIKKYEVEKEAMIKLKKEAESRCEMEYKTHAKTINEIYSSESYKVGNFLVRHLLSLKKILKRSNPS